MAMEYLGRGSQDYIIEKVSESLGEDKRSLMEKEDIRRGICYMLSMEWLRSIIKDGPTDRLMAFNEQATVDRELPYYKQIANNYFVYAQNVSAGWKALTGQPVDIAVLMGEALKGELNTMQKINALFVELCSDKKLAGQATRMFADKQEFATDFRTVQPEYLLFGFRRTVGGASEGHKMACVRVKDGKLLFYDPNFGVQKADDIGDVTEFVYNTYLTNATQYSFNSCEVTRR